MPKCVACDETDERVLRKIEAHHVFSRGYSEETVYLCPNCHARITADQNKFAPKTRKKKSPSRRLLAIHSSLSLLETISAKSKQIIEEIIGDDYNGKDSN
ncbi:MAG: hypothetical protein WC462_00080 [archaeon]